MIKEVESNEARSHWKLMKNSEFKNKYKNKDGKLKTILSIWYFKLNKFTYERLLKYKDILCAHGGIKKVGS